MSTRGLMRVTSHPRLDEYMLLKFPPELNKLIGTFGPAQQALDLGGYVMHRESLGSLQQWARFNAVQLMVETRGTGEPTQPIQCGNVVETWVVNGHEVRDYCSAPYPAGRVPKFCGACGQPAKPIAFGEDEPDIGAKCPSCGRVNHGGPRFCVSCGTSLPEHHLTAPAIRRIKAEPRPLGEAIGELARGLHPRASDAREQMTTEEEQAHG